MITLIHVTDFPLPIKRLIPGLDCDKMGHRKIANV
jgi:hypothetical protein